jgi:hypothetical protein
LACSYTEYIVLEYIYFPSNWPNAKRRRVYKYSRVYGHILGSQTGPKPQLPLKAFPALSVGATGTINSGDVISINAPGYILVAKNGKDDIYTAFINVTRSIYADATPIEGGFKVTVLEGTNGQSYVALTTCKDCVTDKAVSAGSSIIEVKAPNPSITKSSQMGMVDR